MKKHQITSATIFTVIICAWPIFMILSPLSGFNTQAVSLLRDDFMFKLSFIMATLIAPSIVYMLVSLLANKNLNPPRVLALSMLSLYLLLNTLSYSFQYTVFLNLLNAGEIGLAKFFYFGNKESISYFLNQTGYFFWAISVLILFGKYSFEKGVKKAIGIIFSLSAVLSILAYIGLLLNIETLNFLTLPSGVLLLPIGILIIIYSRLYSVKK